jgi:Flp pilus assembly protein TadG
MKSPSSTKRSLRRIRGGNALLEFALAFSLVWACLAGLTEYGQAMHVYNVLAIAVDDAAVYAQKVDFDSSAQTFVTKIKNVAVYGNDSGTGTALVNGLTASKISVTWTTDSGGVPQTITVAVQNFSTNALFATLNWNGKPSSTVRFLGVAKS